MPKFRLKDLRKEQRLSQDELAAKIGVPTRRYASWEREERNLILEDAIKVADALDVSLDELAGRAPRDRYSFLVEAAAAAKYELETCAAMLAVAINSAQRATPIFANGRLLSPDAGMEILLEKYRAFEAGQEITRKE